MLNKKLFRDIWQNKSQFISVFIMIFLGVLCFAGVHSYMDGMQVSGDEYYQENNLQDLVISGENFTENDLNKIKNTANVKDAEREISINTTLDGYDDITIETIFIESNNISKFHVKSGEGFNKEKSGIWLDSYLADNLGLKVGDEITLSDKTYKISEKIIGLINTPDHVYSIKDDTAIFPTHTDYGYAYLSINEFPEMQKQFTSVLVDVNDTAKLQDTKQTLENEIKNAASVTTREDWTSYKCYQSEIDEGKTYSVVFTSLFLFIAVLSVVTTMYRFIRKQRTQIGTMKALGIRKRKIIIHYISFGFWISLVAAVLGMFAGELLIGNIFINIESSYFEMPNCHTAIVPEVYMLTVVTVIVITAITYLSCRTILKEKAADAIRVEVPNVKIRKNDITTKGIFKKMSISTKWNLRDIARNKGRTIMGAVGIIGCTMMLVCAFGMLDTMKSYIDWEFETLNNFNYKLELESNISQQTLDDITNKYGSDTSSNYGIEYKIGDEKKASTLLINDAPNMVRYTDHNKNIIKLNDDGIYITEKLSKTLNKGVGDELEWHIFGESTWHKVKISGINRDPQSQTFNISRKCFENLGENYIPQTVYTNQNLDNVKEIEGVSKIVSKANLKDGTLNMIDAMYTMIVLLVVISAILAFVIIFNLGVLSFTEKQYQFATLKVLGYKDKQIEKIFIKQNIWIAVISIIIGLPLGYLMTDYIFTSALGDNYDFPAEITWLTYIYSAVGTFIVSFIVNKVLAKKIKNIDMVTSLKGNE